MNDNTVSILADAAELAEDIDVARAEAALRQAEHQPRSPTPTPPAEAELRRAQARRRRPAGRL